MRLCELRQKEVINYRDCMRLGYVCDIEFSADNGCLTALLVPVSGKLFGFLSQQQEYKIPWCCVKCIGPDIILVDIDSKAALKEVRC